MKILKKKQKNITKEKPTYEVDLHMHGKHSIDEVLKVDEHEYLFGGTIQEPLFAFTGISVKKEFIRQRGSVLTIFDRGLEFIMFDANKEIYEKIGE